MTPIDLLSLGAPLSNERAKYADILGDEEQDPLLESS